MKTATILPVDYLHLTKDDDYHMCLAHLVGINQKYTEFYKGIGQDPDKYLIMDNGVIEGDRRPIEEIVRKAMSVNAQEIILPDSFKNTDETLDLSYKALQYVKDDFPFKIMAVPQGDTLDHWLDCAYIMLDWDIQVLGIPKVLVNIAGRDGRLEALRYLGNRLRGLEVHLLGCWTTPLEITMIERAVLNGEIVSVRGVDSAIATVYTKAGLRIDDDDRPEVHMAFHMKGLDEELLKTNIQLWKEACHVEPNNFKELF